MLFQELLVAYRRVLVARMRGSVVATLPPHPPFNPLAQDRAYT